MPKETPKIVDYRAIGPTVYVDFSDGSSALVCVVYYDASIAMAQNIANMLKGQLL